MRKSPEPLATNTIPTGHDAGEGTWQTSGRDAGGQQPVKSGSKHTGANMRSDLSGKGQGTTRNTSFYR